MREKNKQVKLSILNNKSVEENNLISALKKAGIKNTLMSVEKVVELQKQQYENDKDVDEIDDNKGDNHFREIEEEEKEQQDEIYEGDDADEGEEDFAMGEDEDNEDDDVLDRDDMGFIYAD
jgi:hypothetical protein